MNLYLRYFDSEILVTNVDDAIAFLANIDDIGMNPMLEKDIRDYAASDVFYPKRYKIRPRVYFIIIKTEAANMQDFKDKKAVHAGGAQGAKPVSSAVMKLNEERFGWYEGSIDFKRVQLVPGTGKFQYRDTHFVARVKASSPILMTLNEPRYGWYEGSILFKRVQQVPGTGKFQYRDTSFVARVKAASGIDCYNRIVAHLSERVDRRSQFPSAKGKNFKFEYLGRCK